MTKWATPQVKFAGKLGEGALQEAIEEAGRGGNELIAVVVQEFASNQCHPTCGRHFDDE